MWGWWLDDVRMYTCPGWAGGVTITSEQPIAVVGRPVIGSQVMTYNGFTGGSTSSYVPMLFKDAFGGSYDAALYIQNVDAVDTANITIDFYDSSGVLNCTLNDTISALSSKGYWVPGQACLPAGWVGGAVVSSDQPIVAVGRPHIGSEITTYDGFSGGFFYMYLPMLFKTAYGGTYNAALYVQNVDPVDTANITISYYDTAGAFTCSVPDTIAPFASKGYWTPSVSCLPAGWVGGATIISDRSIVAIGRPHIGAQITTYNGVDTGGLTSYVPMLYKNASGSNAALYIQNVDPGSTANISIDYYDRNGVLSCTVNDTIALLSTKGYWMPAVACLPSTWTGSAVITSDLPVIALGRPHIGAEVTTYTGVPAGNTSIYVPMLFSGAFGGTYNAAFYIQNLTGTPSNLTIQFFNSAGTLTCTLPSSPTGHQGIDYWIPSLCGP
jgi:hypothetical protein